jgi:hypothetical protein
MPEPVARFSERSMYTFLNSGIHLIVLKQATRQALDECFEYATEIYRNASPGTPLLLIIDLRSAGLPPLLDVARHVLRLRRRVSQQQPRRIAIVYSADRRHSTLHRVIAWMDSRSRDKVRFFPHTQWNKVTRWLLSTLP